MQGITGNTRPVRVAGLGRRVLAAAAMAVGLALVPAMAACGGEAEEPTGPAATGQEPAESGPPAEPGQDGATTNLKLTGAYTFEGPFTGQLTCYHDASRYFYLEGQRPYYLSIIVNDTQDGTFVVNKQDPATGFIKAIPGEPQMDIRGLTKVEGDDGRRWRNDGGSITIVDGGTSGTLSLDWADIDGTSATVHSELTWEDCPLI